MGAPLDSELRNLGDLFHTQIVAGEWEEAKETLDKIEERTIFLLKQPYYIDPKKL